MDLATLVINIAVPIGTVLLALIVYAPLSAVFWRQFLKLSAYLWPIFYTQESVVLITKPSGKSAYFAHPAAR